MTNFDINKVYVGDTQVEKIYLGTDVVYEATPVGPTAHTASVLLDGSEVIDLPETLESMYEMAFSEPYTSITLYYDNEVVTASTLTISVDGSQSITETDFEVANIDTDMYDFSSINSISFYAAANEVYIDFAP